MNGLSPQQREAIAKRRADDLLKSIIAIQKVDLQKGDTLVVSTEGVLIPEQREHLLAFLREQLGDYKVLVLERMHLSVLHATDRGEKS